MIIIGLKIYRIRWKKTQNNGYITAFKVIQGHRGRYTNRVVLVVALLLRRSKNFSDDDDDDDDRGRYQP